MTGNEVRANQSNTCVGDKTSRPCVSDVGVQGVKSTDLFGVCPYVTAQQLLAGKWPIFIMYALMEGPVRFNELLRRMPVEMTHATLTRQLKDMQAKELIVRREYPQVPPRVEYELSEVGRAFEPVLEAMGTWGRAYIERCETGEKAG